MKRAVESQTRFVSDLLDYSRGAQGKLSLEPQRVPICEPVRRAIEATGAAAAQHRVTIQISEEDSDARVWGDPVRLQQVFTNLLENATKFTPPGGSVAIYFVTSGDTLEVRVTDTGVGISPDLLPIIFEPFAQSDGTRDAKQGGLGVGLSISKGIIDLHGGSLLASSAGPGTGTTFVVRLPLSVAAQTPGVGC
jgi:signal transduction histidine kinase